MDYAALAAQFGGTSASSPAAAPQSQPQVDYAKLAQQFGGTTAAASGSAPAAQVDQPSIFDKAKQQAANVVGGLVRGAGSIGATLLAPVDMISDAIAGKGLSLASNDQRRQDMDSALTSLGADPNSYAYKGFKLAGEVAGTAGAGGVVAAPLRAAAALAPRAAVPLNALAEAAASGGFRTGLPESVATNGLAKAAGVAANLGTRAAGGALAGGAAAGLVDPRQAGTGAILGGALPPALQVAGAAGQAIGRSVLGSALSPEVKALAQKASDLGIEIPADRLANSKPLNAVAAGLNYVPGSGRAAVEARMHDQLSSALSKTFGQDSPNVTMALRKAEGDLGPKFDAALQNGVNVDHPFLTDLANSANMASRELGADGASIIHKQIDDIIDKAGSGQIDGQAAYNIKKTLDRIGSRNSPEAFYALDLKKSLMGALDRSLGPEAAADFAKTRRQYGTMLDLQKLAQNGAEGDISIARLANLKNINNPDLQDLADISAQFLKAREGAHGASQRAFAGMGVAGLGTGLAGPIGGAVGLAGSALAGRALNSALDSNALRRILLAPPGEVGSMNALTTALTSPVARTTRLRGALLNSQPNAVDKGQNN